MAHILALYATSHGHTRKVVEHLADGLRTRGHTVTLWPAATAWPEGFPDSFDAFLVAGSIVYGKHQRYLTRRVRALADRLNRFPGVFISVCGVLAGTAETAPATAHGYVARFLAETGWHPRRTLSVAGALPYTRYGLITRWIMKSVSRHIGRPTDTSRDYEFTDWQPLDRFTGEWADELAGAHPLRDGVPAEVG